MDFVLRDLMESDIHEVSKIYVEAYAEGMWNELWNYNTAKKRISEMFSSPQYRGYVAILNREIVGCIICEILTWHTGKQLEVKEIFVFPQYQKKGIGKKLINYIKKIAKESGVTEVYLWTKKEQSLMEFYSDIGFCGNYEVVQFMKKEMEELS